jgi:hypothetical protein
MAGTEARSIFFIDDILSEFYSPSPAMESVLYTSSIL